MGISQKHRQQQQGSAEGNDCEEKIQNMRKWEQESLFDFLNSAVNMYTRPIIRHLSRKLMFFIFHL